MTVSVQYNSLAVGINTGSVFLGQLSSCQCSSLTDCDLNERPACVYIVYLDHVRNRTIMV